MTVYACECGKQFDFLISTHYQADAWGAPQAYHLHDNFDEWREWLTQHKPHGEITAIEYQGSAA